jgi:hypothetical protein
VLSPPAHASGLPAKGIVPNMIYLIWFAIAICIASKIIKLLWRLTLIFLAGFELCVIGFALSILWFHGFDVKRILADQRGRE